MIFYYKDGKIFPLKLDTKIEVDIENLILRVDNKNIFCEDNIELLFIMEEILFILEENFEFENELSLRKRETSFEEIFEFLQENF